MQAAGRQILSQSVQLQVQHQGILAGEKGPGAGVGNNEGPPRHSLGWTGVWSGKKSAQCLRGRMGLPWWLSALKKKKKSACQYRRHRFSLWSRKIPHDTGQLSPRATTPEPMLQSPGAVAAEACPLQSLCSAAREDTSVRGLFTATRG